MPGGKPSEDHRKNTGRREPHHVSRKLPEEPMFAEVKNLSKWIRNVAEYYSLLHHNYAQIFLFRHIYRIMQKAVIVGPTVMPSALKSFRYLRDRDYATTCKGKVSAHTYIPASTDFIHGEGKNPASRDMKKNKCHPPFNVVMRYYRNIIPVRPLGRTP